MEQQPITPNQNQNEGFFRRNARGVFIVVIIAVVAVGIYFATKQSKTSSDTAQNDETGQQNTDQNTNTDENEQMMTEPSPAPATAPQATGSFTSTGTLAQSTDLVKGNLVLETGDQKIYISTRRDFSSLIGKQVTVNGDGTIKSFVFLGFSEGGTGGVVSGAGTSTESRDLEVTGKLEKSDNLSRGNYIVNTGTTKVYFQTKFDRTDWVGSEVALKATGKIESFTNAVIAKK